MPRTSRKANFNFNNYTATSKRPSGSAAATSGGASLSVTKFGQTTYTSIRRQKDGENGSFVPLKTALDNKVQKEEKSDEEVVQQTTTTTSKVDNSPKPKVYKFFKSRSAPSDQSPNGKQASSSSSSSSTKQVSPTPKADTSKRVLSPKRYTRTKDKPEPSAKKLDLTKVATVVLANSNNNTSSNTTTLPKKGTAEPKTAHVIKNSARKSNVRCVSSPSPFPVTQATGVRISRRLQGVEPETIKLQASKSHQQDQNNKLAAAIENVFGPASKVEQEENVKKAQEEENLSQKQEPEIVNGNYEKKIESTDEDKFVVPEAKPEPVMPTKIAQPKTIVESNKIDFNFELDSDDVEQDIDVKKQSCPSKKVVVEPTKDDDDVFTPREPIFTGNVQPSSSQSSSAESTASTSAAVKPKKKIFFNRSRNKVEFNTKSLFASETKDEFDLDGGSEPTAQPKKQKKELDEDNYLKLKRIRKAHQCHDSGETEQFDEDIKYYLSGIISSNPVSMRCLSIMALSQHTMRPEFRMHLRAHDDMPQIIKALMDAPNDASLALCAACLMFVYNQDRMTMDIDPNALSLMLELLETRSDECHQVGEKHRNSVISLVEEMKNKGHAKYLKLTEITAGKLAMETLLGLTSKRAGDWFKMELRKMKGIDFIVNTVMRCADNYLEDGQMIKIDRCMHVLENVSFENHENQLYITGYNDGQFISKCIYLLETCKEEIMKTKESKIYLSAFFSVLRVLTNLTSESVDGCTAVGSFPGIIKLLLDALFDLPAVIIQDQRFDLMVIILCLCINLAEFCEQVRSLVLESDENVTKLTDLLFKKIEEAAQVEQATDQMLESHESVQMTEAMQDNLLMQMISKSGTHMEHSLISACVCLLFGCCIQDNTDYRTRIEQALPNGSFDPLIEMLEKLRDFAHLADIMTQKGKDRVTKILKMYKSFKQQQQQSQPQSS